MLKVKFDPNTNVLIVETQRTVKFKEKIILGLWNPVKDAAGDTIFDIQVMEDDSDGYEFKVEGVDKDELENMDEKYDLSDILSAESYKVTEFKKKCIFLALKITNGEYEYYSKSVHQIGAKVDKDKFAEKYAKTFYSGKADNQDGTYYFNGGEVAVEVYSVKDVTLREYRTLNKFL